LGRDRARGEVGRGDLFEVEAVYHTPIVVA
jgi:hypothetical protein